MVHSEVYLCCQNSAVLYTCLPWLLSNVQKTALVLHVSLFNFSSIFPGGQLAPFAPMCGRPWFLRLRVWLEFSTDGAWRQNGPENLLVIPEDLYCVTRLQGSKKTRTAVGTSLRDVRRYGEYRDGHGLGPSTGWVGLGRIFQHMWWVGLRWVGLNEKYCGIVAEYCKTHTFHCP